MAYISRTDLTPGRIKPDFFASALDDDKDEVEDVGLADAIIAQACADVDGYLTRYNPPLASPPAIVKSAAIAFAGYEIYRRGGYAEAPQNPFAKDRDYFRTQLELIAEGERNLGIESALPGGGPVAVITEPAKTHSSNGNLLF